MAYNQSNHVVTNKSLGVVGLPTDARSYYYDSVNFLSRQYISKEEVIAYLDAPYKREGHFPVYINTGGTIGPNGILTGGVTAEYWFKDGTDIEHLVEKNTGSNPAINISLPVYLLSNYASVSAFLTEVGSAECELWIDSSITVAAGTHLVIPQNVDVVMKAGGGIYGPVVVRDMTGASPITGTVADNYGQLTFEGSFTCGNGKVFYNDVLIWFNNTAVKTIQADWWGITKLTTSPFTYMGSARYEQAANIIIETENVRSIQKAAVCACEGDNNFSASKTLAFSQGSFAINSPIVFVRCSIEAHPFLTGRRISGNITSTIVKIMGAEPVKHEVNNGNTTNLCYTANWGAPFMLQALRNSEISNIRYEGRNRVDSKDSVTFSKTSELGLITSAYAKIVLRRDNFSAYDTTQTDWISDSIDWGRRKPYAAIITDPFSTTLEGAQYNFGYAGTTVDLYCGRTGHQNSWDVKIRNSHFRRFVSAIVNTLTAQQGDTYLYEGLMFNELVFGISTCQDQSRDCKMIECSVYGPVHTVLDNILHGDTPGVCPEILSLHMFGGVKYLINEGVFQRGIVNINNIYSELIYGIGSGLIGDGEGSNPYPVVVTNSTFKRESGRKYSSTKTVNGSDVTTTYFLPRAPETTGVTFRSCMLGSYSGSITAGKEDFLLFRNCEIDNSNTFQWQPDWFPLDAAWFDYYPQSSNTRDIGLSIPPLVSNVRKPLSFSNRYRDFKLSGVVELKNTPIHSHLVRHRIAGVTVSATANYCARIDKNGVADFDNIIAGDMIRFISTSGGIGADMGIVYEKTSTHALVGGLNKDNYTNFTTNAATYRVDIVTANASHTEFNAWMDAADKSSVLVNYWYKYIGHYIKPSVNDFIKMPDGNLYRVATVSDTAITLKTPYTGSLFSDTIFAPVTRINNTVGFSTSSAGYYTKGSAYTENATTYAACVKSGDYGFTDATTAQYRAKFIRYQDGKELDYLDGTTTTTILHSGTTAQRPNTAVIPLKKGFIYSNTETGINETWTGTSWYGSKPTEYLTQAEYDAITPDANTNYVIIG